MLRRGPDVRIGLLAVTMALSCAWTAHRGGSFIDATAMSPSAIQGERVYAQHCLRCHGGGEAEMALGLDDRSLPPAMIALRIRTGGRAMPAFAANALDDADLTRLVDYLTELRRQPPKSL